MDFERPRTTNPRAAGVATDKIAVLVELGEAIVVSPRILYASGSIGLGHVTRDLAVAREIRLIEPDSEIVWLAAPPASDLLRRAGEVLAPEHTDYRCETELAESVGRSGHLNLTKYVYRALGPWLSNARVFGRAADAGYDILIGNETYEIVVAYVLGLDVLPRVPYVMMYDFYGMDLATTGVFERLGAWALNFVWAQEARVTSRPGNRALFFGELQDIPDRRFGLFLPSRQAYAADHVDFVGYALPFNENDIADRAALRARLGYGPEPLVVCSIGGTAVGRDLLKLCAEAYTLAQSRIANLRMVLVCGPRVDPANIPVPPGVERRGMVDDLWRHFAVCDLAVVQGGGTTTLELEALRRPFLCFPVEGQSEQEVTIANRLRRHRAGVLLKQSATTAEALSNAIVANIGAEVDSMPLQANGARRAAEVILSLAPVQR